MDHIRRVAIIGAGPVGIATAKYLLAEDFLDVLDVYEQQSAVGGVWLHTPTNPAERPDAPQTDPFQPLQPPMWVNGADPKHPLFMTPMYDNLDTNIPAELMKFSDLSFPERCQLFPPREDVLEYLNAHAADVVHLVRFQHQVLDLSLQSGAHNSWRLRSRNLLTGEEICATYDAVAICSGHYTVPYIPDHEGLQEWNTAGLIMHSKFYRSPKEYQDKKVLVVGNAASGIDIAAQISKFCAGPLLLSQRGESLFSAPSNAAENASIKILPGVAEFIGLNEAERSVRFANGHIENNIDVVLWATGYLFSFPFLNATDLGMIKDGGRVMNTYQHLFHIDHPSLALPGLPLKVLPFPLSEAQAAVVARVWSGRLELPSPEQMREWELGTIRTNGDGRAFHVLLFPKDFEYQRELTDWASQAPDGKLPRRFDEKAAWTRKRFPAIKRAFAREGENRHNVRTLEMLGYDYERWLKEGDDCLPS